MKTLVAAVWAGMAVVVIGLGGCRRSALLPQGAEPPAAADDTGYRRPPQARAAVRTADGDVALSGIALPGAAVRLASPDGRHLESAADANGAWILDAPRGGPAIYGLSQAADGRRDQAEGYLAVLPSGSPAAAELRAGAGAVVLAGRRQGQPSLLAADIDGSGVAVVSGWATPGQPLRVTVDGAEADQGSAGADGRFALSLPKPLAPGARKVQVLGPGGSSQATVDVSPPPAFAGVMRAVPLGDGWRLDWRTPAGGVQTTELFAAMEPGP